MSSPDDLLGRFDLARSLINEAGQMALSYFADRDHLGIDTKLNGQDVVSIADKAVEALIRREIATCFPDDGFLGEETGLTTGTSGWRWTIDPIDGTSCFVHGLASWCISIAVSDATEQTQIGLILAPVSGELFEAVRGKGAKLNGQGIQVDTKTSLQTGFVGLGASHRVAAQEVSSVLEALLLGGGMFVRSGSGALSIAEVAAGRLAAYYEPHINAWDCLAGLLIVREAGGFTADFPGPNRTLLAGGPVLAAAPQIAAPLLNLIASARIRASEGQSA